MAREREIRVDVRTTQDGRALEKTADQLDKVSNKADGVDESLAAVEKTSGDTDKAVDGLADTLGTAEKASGDADKATEKLAASLDHAAHSADKTRESFGGTEQQTKSLIERIRDAEQEVQRLAVSFDRSGDQSEVKAWKKAKRELSELTRLAKDAGVEVNKLKPAGAMEGLSGSLVPALAGAGILAAPLVAGAIAGAVLGGVGIGGVVGGAVLAAKSSQVRQAWSDVGSDLHKKLSAAAAGFEAPLVRAAGTFGSAFDASGITAALARAAKLVDPLAAGAAGFVQQLGPGLNAAVAGSEPTIRMLSSELPRLGASISDMFFSLEHGSEGAALGLQDLLRLTEGVISGTGHLLGDLSRAYEHVRPTIVTTGKAIGIVGDVVHYANAALNPGRGVVLAYGEAIDRTRIPVRGLTDDLRTLDGAVADTQSIFMSQDQATLAYQRGMLDLQKTLAENGKHWETNTEKGLANREALLRQVNAAERIREANIKAGQSAQDADRHYNDQITTLYELAKAAGASKETLDDLVGTYRINVLATFAIKQAVGQAMNLVGGAFKGFAAGGTTPAHEPFRVHDGEVLWSDRQQYVSTKAQTEQLARTGSGGGGQNVTLTVMPGGSDAFARALVELISRYVRVDGQGRGESLGIKTVRAISG